MIIDVKEERIAELQLGLVDTLTPEEIEEGYVFCPDLDDLLINKRDCYFDESNCSKIKRNADPPVKG